MTDLIPAQVTLEKARRALEEAYARRRRIEDRAVSAVAGIEDMARKAGVAFTVEDQFRARELAAAYLGIEQAEPQVLECEDELLVAMFDAGLLSVTELHLARKLRAARIAALGVGLMPLPPA